jgi:hypothetical protein
MTRDEIVRLARECGFGTLMDHPIMTESMIRLGFLVAAAERKSMDLNAIHSCHAQCQNPFCVRVREAVAHEREACAKLCEDIPLPKGAAELTHLPTIERCVNAIRARSNTGIKWEVEP